MIVISWSVFLYNRKYRLPYKSFKHFFSVNFINIVRYSQYKIGNNRKVILLQKKRIPVQIIKNGTFKILI